MLRTTSTTTLNQAMKYLVVVVVVVGDGNKQRSGGGNKVGVGRECVAVEVEERESSTLVIIAASVRSYMRA